MDNLNTLTSIVLGVLRKEPDTRNSDYELYYEICKIKNPATLGMKFGTVLKNRNELGIPSIESVGRARRKIVENHPELAGNDEVQGGRWSSEQAFKQYAKECHE